MRILFISAGNGIDYQCDCLFHGLNSLRDVEVYTLNEYRYMFQGNPADFLLKQYGKGFTISNRIPLSRFHLHSAMEAKEKIAAHYYDAVIYGSIFRCQALLDMVIRHYTKNEIIFIDGEDCDFKLIWRKKWRGYLGRPGYNERHRNKALYYASLGMYFKRELREEDRPFFLPVSFAVPAENIVAVFPEKTRDMATIIPGKLETYIYDSEDDYYQGYREARWGTTVKKAGWDCLRHYEILANACIPYFPGLEKCPQTTMVNFPKSIILETNRLYESRKFTPSLFEYYCKGLWDYTRKYLTTRELATYVLSFLG